MYVEGLWGAVQLDEGFPRGTATRTSFLFMPKEAKQAAQYRRGLMALTVLLTLLKGARLIVFVFGNLILCEEN